MQGKLRTQKRYLKNPFQDLFSEIKNVDDSGNVSIVLSVTFRLMLQVASNFLHLMSWDDNLMLFTCVWPLYECKL